MSKMLRFGAAAVTVVLAVFGALASCSSSHPSPPSPLSKDELMDPETCKGCHASHYGEWSGSMHAYAAVDPVFVAMNARFLRETGGANPSFCVQCHAPMALRTGATTDGKNLASLPASLRGVTCYFCHTVDSVDGAHNDPLHLSDDLALRGDISDPTPAPPHAAQYSALHDRDRIDSAPLCGACHDVTSPTNVDIETTFAEWRGALYSHDVPGQRLTCSGCHMAGSDAPVADVAGAPVRRSHDHSMAALDTALTPFPNTDAQRASVQGNLDPAIVAKLCVTPQATQRVSVTLDNAFVGHSWPSGAVHDRRAWVELVAYANGQIVFQSGVVPEGQSVTAISDPALWLMRETLLDAQSKEVHMLWQAASTKSSFLPVAVTNDPKDPKYFHAVTQSYDVPQNADRITLRVRIIPIGLDVVDDLIASGDLDASVRPAMAKLVYTLAGTQLEWTSAKGTGCIP
jgi:hypothetical protein